ncbi:glycosyltransferase [Streptomyces coeruleorubidus]|uniref:glycosyltransferase n=1 Tax=Streptomyces coeruleorubidus TaxID=116188 RepID=UPI0036F684FC
MRILFTGPSRAGHVFPMIPTAQALRSAGHDVLFAGQIPVDDLTPTGFPVVEVGDGSTLTDALLRANGRGLPFVSGERTEEETWRMALAGYAQLSRSTIDDLLRLAEAWRPDVIVHATMHAAAPLVAARQGIPTVVHHFGVAAALPMVDSMTATLADECQARGVTGPPHRTVLDVVPASLGGDGSGWRVRYVPFNGGGQVPTDLTVRGDRRKVAVTLGTVMRGPALPEFVARLAEQAATADAKFLLAAGATDLTPLGTLPSNVRPLTPWVPLAPLLDACDAVIHHGGAGSMMTAAAVGVPQLIVPQGADNFSDTAAAVTRGIALRAAAVDAELLDTLLNDTELRKTALATRDKIAALPSPAALVADFEGLATAHR